MHDDEEAFLRDPWQRNMPFISTPTQTTNVYQAAAGGDYTTQDPPGVTAAPVIAEDTSPFILAVDTCGFTTGTTGKIRRGCHEDISNKGMGICCNTETYLP